GGARRARGRAAALPGRELGPHGLPGRAVVAGLGGEPARPHHPHRGRARGPAPREAAGPRLAARGARDRAGQGLSPGARRRMRPALVGSAFFACLAALLAAMAWSSSTVLRLEAKELAAKAQATLEENTRLALWRMDSALTPLLAQESARPYFHYDAFYPARRPYTSMFETVGPGEMLVASPLLRETPARIVLHFQLDPAGVLTSPQVPAGRWRTLAPSGPRMAGAGLSKRAARLQALGGVVSRQVLSAELARQPAPPPAAAPAAAVPAPGVAAHKV